MKTSLRLCGVSSVCVEWWRRGRRLRIPQPDESAALLVTRQVLGVDEFNLEVLERLVIELEVPLERAIGHTTSLTQERDHLIHHRDKVHPISSLPGALSAYPYVTPS